MVGVVEVIALYFTRRHIVRIFTETLKIEDTTLVCVLVCIFFDYCQGVLCGVIKALGQQKRAAYINVVSYYVVALPLASLFSFGRFGQKGLWIGTAFGLFIQIFLYLWLILKKTDWEKASLHDKSYKEVEMETTVE